MEMNDYLIEKVSQLGQATAHVEILLNALIKKPASDDVTDAIREHVAIENAIAFLNSQDVETPEKLENYKKIVQEKYAFVTP